MSEEKTGVTDLTKSQNLPANITKMMAHREVVLEKLELIREKEEQLKNAKAQMMAISDRIDSALLEHHKKVGDFQIGDLMVTKKMTFSTEVVDEDKLPGSCFKLKQEKVVVKAKVKELILDGTIPREVAYQKKSEKINIK